MSKGYQNVQAITGAFRKTMSVQPGETCLLCGRTATHKLETLGGGKPACELHARQGVKLGFHVEPTLIKQ